MGMSGGSAVIWGRVVRELPNQWGLGKVARMNSGVEIHQEVVATGGDFDSSYSSYTGKQRTDKYGLFRFKNLRTK